MNADCSAVRNPFATRYVRPGAMEFLFPPATDARQLIARLERNGWWGQIVGPHGSGKSTLLQALIPELQAAGRTVQRIGLRSGQRRLPWGRSQAAGWQTDTLVAVDGYEQLGWFARLRLRRWCRHRGAGLLVTAHSSAGLAELWHTAPSLQLAQVLVDRLLEDQERGRVSAADVEQAFRDCQGNLRETWFRLYDVYHEYLECRLEPVPRAAGSSQPCHSAPSLFSPGLYAP